MSKLGDHWDEYVKGIGALTKPTSTASINSTHPAFQNTSTKIGVSGFLDLKPVSTSAQEFQARYDAMAGSWEGVSASEKAVLKSRTDRTEFMPLHTNPK
jgi:hypothetical protein